MIWISPGPSTARTVMANARNGMASCMSAKRVTTVSSHPPRKPAHKPTKLPTLPDTSTALAPMSNDTRDPQMIRDSRSRPN